MPPESDVLSVRTWLGFAVAAGVLAALAAFVVFVAGSAWAAAVWRGAATVWALIVLARLVRTLRGQMSGDAAWRERLWPRAARTLPDPAFSRLATDLALALSRPRRGEERHLGPSLWERLRAAGLRRGLASGDLEPLLSRHDQQALEQLLSAIETTG